MFSLFFSYTYLDIKQNIALKIIQRDKKRNIIQNT